MISNKLLLTVAAIVLFACIFTFFVTVVHAKSSNFLFSREQNLIVTLKNEADINTSKNIILEIPHIKIIKITDRVKEWSKMVNKMDLPKMDNPFKNEFVVKINKKADINEIFNKIKEMDFVENVKYVSDTKE